MEAKDFDALIGIHVFTTKTPGIGGRLRFQPEDFVVQEISRNGCIAPLEPTSTEYPDQRGKFTAFFLVKRNLDTIQAIRRLAKTLGISYKRFSYAGIKDRRAVTSQQVTLYRAAPHDLIGWDLPNIKVLHPYRVSKPIVPGSHLGNRFRIVIRHIEVSVSETSERLVAIKQEIDQQRGILNFFGPQRFGIIQPTTHLIGKQILLGNLEEAIRILLEKVSVDVSRPVEPNNSDEGEKLISNQAHQRLPNQTYERAISQYLAKHPGDYRGSFRVLPKDLVRLYIHAYQAYLFNRTVSERVTRGISLHQPVVGDFVMPVTGEIHAVRMVTAGTFAQAKEDIRRGRQKLVIPIIGYDFKDFIFEGVTGEILTTLFSDEEITPSYFRLLQLPKLSSRGTFRPLLIQPDNMQYTILKQEEDVTVKFNFDLAKGSYASVVLREFIKPQRATQL